MKKAKKIVKSVIILTIVLWLFWQLAAFAYIKIKLLYRQISANYFEKLQ